PGAAFAQFDFRTRSHVVFRFLEQFKQSIHRLAIDLRRFEQRPAFVSDPIDAAMGVVAVGIANVVLHVSDKLVGPVEEINGTVRRNIDRSGTEIRIVRLDQVFDRLPFQAGAVLADLHPEDALETNDVAVEEISLKVIREMAAGDQAGAGAGTRGALPELLHLSVFRRVIKMTAESRSEEGFVAGRIGN